VASFFFELLTPVLYAGGENEFVGYRRDYMASGSAGLWEIAGIVIIIELLLGEGRLGFVV